VSDFEKFKNGDPSFFVGDTAKTFLGWRRHPEMYLGSWLDEIADRLPHRHERTFLLGMGGSSSPAMFYSDFRPNNQLSVLDTSNPDTIAATDFSNAQVIASSKSGGTIETQTLLAQALANGLAPADLIVITDPGTVLEEQGRELGATVIHGDPECGGRFSSISPFGLVPALYAQWTPDELRNELAGCSLSDELFARAWQDAEAMANHDEHGAGFFSLRNNPITNGGALWLEQLIAETTGKEDRGFIPVPALPLETYRPRDMMYWHLVASLLAWHLQNDPFNQPNVEFAKKSVFSLLEGAISWEAPSVAVDELRRNLSEASYNVLQVYAPLDTSDALSQLRDRVENTYGPTTANLGPRYLHSTGQLHKGGPRDVVGVQIVQRPAVDPWLVPGRSYTFHDLHMAQAQGDLQAMRAAKRTVHQLVVDNFDEAAAMLGV